MANVLNKLPKSIQPKAKSNLHEISNAPTKELAGKAFDEFVEKYEAKYPAASECLSKDRDVLLSFYEFPAKHWLQLRTTNQIESTFASIRLRHRKTKGSGAPRASSNNVSNARAAMMFKLAESAGNRWRRLRGYDQMIHILQGSISKNESEIVRHLFVIHE